MRNIALGMAATALIGAAAIVGFVQGKAATPLVQISEVWEDEHCRSCIPGNGEINVDESYSFGAEGSSGTLTFPPVVPCAANPHNTCHSGFFFQYGTITRWKGNKTAVTTLWAGVDVQEVRSFTIRLNGEWINCIDWTINPPTEGLRPTLTVSGGTTVQVAGVLRYRFPQHDDWCLR